MVLTVGPVPTDPFQRHVHVRSCSSVKAIFGHPCKLPPREPCRCSQARQVPIMVPTCAKRATVGLVPLSGTRFRLHNFRHATLGSTNPGLPRHFLSQGILSPAGRRAYCHRPLCWFDCPTHPPVISAPSFLASLTPPA